MWNGTTGPALLPSPAWLPPPPLLCTRLSVALCTGRPSSADSRATAAAPTAPRSSCGDSTTRTSRSASQRGRAPLLVLRVPGKPCSLSPLPVACPSSKATSASRALALRSSPSCTCWMTRVQHRHSDTHKRGVYLSWVNGWRWLLWGGTGIQLGRASRSSAKRGAVHGDDALWARPAGPPRAAAAG